MYVGLVQIESLHLQGKNNMEQILANYLNIKKKIEIFLKLITLIGMTMC